MNPAWSTVPVTLARDMVAFDMTPVWKSASQVPVECIHTINDTMQRKLSVVANAEIPYSWGERDDGNE